MENSYRDEEAQPCLDLRHSGLLDPKEWNHLKEFENRDHEEELAKDQVKAVVMDQEIKHPHMRKMVPVDSDAFRWAVSLVTGEIVKARNRHQGVMHLECCNVIWIGEKPRVCTHIVNEELRGQLDLRSQTKKKYNPTFTPINIVQYCKAGGCPYMAVQRLKDQELEEMSTASTNRTRAVVSDFNDDNWDKQSDNYSDDESEDSVLLG